MSLADVFIKRSNQNISELTDDELMSLIGSGDKFAFQVIYEKYKARIFHFCLRTLNDREAAKDVLQEVFIRVFKKNESYKKGTSFPGWLHSIARNLCLNVIRDRKITVEFDEFNFGYNALDTSEQDVLLSEILNKEIQRLPDIYREAIILFEYEGYSYPQICELINVPLSTVRFRIFKAREILRGKLASLFKFPEE
ncbi:MAG: RNA polymerase sigma factor [Chlorobiota bacterium]|nr:RNA polymerase sigma factor [Chlorobiota bacterium]QQS66812.1 MAG: RNA polymerase sigma factor [Chlorobiota bacterium]